MNDGTYRARAISTDLIVSTKNTDGIEITFKLVNGETKKATLWFSEKSQERSFETLRGMGFRGEDVATFYACDDCSKILPNEVDLVIETEIFEAEDHEGNIVERKAQKIKYINMVGGSQAKRMEPGQMSSFAARFRAMSAAKGNSQPAQTQSLGKNTDGEFRF